MSLPSLCRTNHCGCGKEWPDTWSSTEARMTALDGRLTSSMSSYRSGLVGSCEEADAADGRMCERKAASTLASAPSRFMFGLESASYTPPRGTLSVGTKPSDTSRSPKLPSVSMPSLK